MAKNIERESLVSAMAYCSLRDLPDVDNGEEIWIHALAKVEKTDGSTSYVLVSKVDASSHRIIKDFGTISSIRKIVSYHPYSFLKASYLPKFKTEKKEERLSYLDKWGEKGVNYASMSKKELDLEILNIAIKNQKTKENYA